MRKASLFHGGWCLLLLLLLGRSVTADDDEEDLYSTPPRVIIEPFVLSLQPIVRNTISSQSNMLTLLGLMEVTITDYINDLQGRRRLQAPQLQYVKFASGTPRYENNVVEVDVSAGVVSYTNHPTPEASQVQSWVQTSLESDLVNVLRNEPAFAMVTSVEYRRVDGNSNSGSQASPADGSSSNNNTPLIAGAAAGGACLLLVAGLWAARRKRIGSVPSHSREVSYKPNDLEEPPEASFSNHNNNSHSDHRSVAESESEWTMNTEAGDSTALKSLHATVVQTLGSHEGESFEADRPIALSKDMLVGQWSGHIHTPTAAATTGESVLQPSYFSAATEQQTRQQQVDSEVDSELSSSGSGSSDDEPSSFRLL